MEDNIHKVPKKSSGAFALMPLISLVLVIYAVLINMDMLDPIYSEDLGSAMYMVIAGQVLLLIVLIIGFTRKEKVEREELDYCRTTRVDSEEEVGVSVKGKKIEGEELLEAEVIEVEEIEEEPQKLKRPAIKFKAKPRPKANKVSIPGLGPEWEVFEYPGDEPGAIFSDVLIPISMEQKTLLKHRTKVARACIHCEDQVECWPKARRKMTKEEFIENIDCKDGLREKGVPV